MPNKDNRKRKSSESDELLELKSKLKKLERKMLRGRRRRRIVSSSSEESPVPTPTPPPSTTSTERSRSHQRQRSPSLVQESLRGSRSSSPRHRAVQEQALAHVPAIVEPSIHPSEPTVSVGPRDLTPTKQQEEPLVEPSTELLAEPLDAQVHTELELSTEYLEILGEDPTISKNLGKNIHKDLAIRFEHISTNGLTKEQRKELRDKYLVPANCTLINAPQVNPELKAAVSENITKRLKGMEQKQCQIASAISCLGEAITFLMSQSPAKDTDSNLLKLLMDASRLICDIQYSDSLTRRYLILAVLKKEMKDQLLLTKIDSFLFGKDLSETLKSAKAINKSGAELKQTPAFTRQPPKKTNNYKSFIKNNLNSKTTPTSRRSTGSSRSQEPAPKNQPASSSRSSRQTSRRSQR